MNNRYTEDCRVCLGSGRTLKSGAARELRLKHSKTLKEVAQKMGISMSYLSDLEKGRKNWNAELEADFANALQ